jgi:hypothetical protein
MEVEREIQGQPCLELNPEKFTGKLDFQIAGP